jgi:serine O-acetyltransferase
MTLPGLILSDLRAKAAWVHGHCSTGTMLKTLLADGTPAMICYRLMQWSRKWHLTPFEMFFNRFNSGVCGCVIGRGAEFGPRFVLVHANGTVINGAVRGGSDVILEHQVTIGAEKRQFPTLGNKVFVGAGAKILGPVTIGSRVRIGANAVVLTDVPNDATAVGVPAKVVRIHSEDESKTGEIR